MGTNDISREKRSFGVGVVGGSTVVLDIAGLRLATDPTFNQPGTYNGLTKTEPPALSPAQLGVPDVILLSHDQHTDNFDDAGRAYAQQAPLILTTPGGAKRLAGRARGLAPWEHIALPRPDGAGDLIVQALPAVHGPLDGATDEHGWVNCEVTGFLLRGDGLPTIYVSGDNASITPVAEIAARVPAIDVAVLFAGAARTPRKDNARPLTLTSERAADAALLLGARTVVPAHYQSWSIYTEGADRLTAAFNDAGISDRLRLGRPGTWHLTETRP